MTATLARASRQGERWNRRKSGELFPAPEDISVVKDTTGATRHYLSVLSDITPVKAAEARLNHLAHHDTLTGLAHKLIAELARPLQLLRARTLGDAAGAA